MWEKAGVDLDRKAEAVSLPTRMASWRYCVRGSQVRVRTFPEVEIVGLANLGPMAVALYLTPSQRVFLLSLVAASSYWACRAADLELLRHDRSGHLPD